MLRDNLAGLIEPMLGSARTYSLALHPNESSDDRPQNALKIPARQGGIYTLAENVASPFHAEPAQDDCSRTDRKALSSIAASNVPTELGGLLSTEC